MLSRIAWRLFRHELSRGDLWVIAFAMLLTVFSVVTLSGITQSVRDALLQRSSQLSAADLVVRSSVRPPAQWFEVANATELSSSEIQLFNTMVYHGDAMQLTSIKAVDQFYPLRGNLVLSTARQQLERVLPGQLFVDQQLLQRLQLVIGDEIEVGLFKAKITGVIQQEPDAPLNLFGGNPRLLMSTADVAATQVIQPGSQVSYRALFAGESASIAAFKAQLEPTLAANARIQQLDRQTTLGATLDRAERFILLAGLLGIILSCCAAAVAAKRYSERQRQSIAILKAIGLTQSQSRRLYFSHLFFIVLSSAVIGMGLGQVAISASGALMSQLLSDYQPKISWLPFQLGALTALLCAGLFAARPIWMMAQTPALDVLRQGARPLKFDWLHLVLSALAVYCLMWFFSRDLMLSAILFGACAVAALVIFALAALVLRVSKPLGVGQTGSFVLALASIRRRIWPNAFQLVTFTLAIFLSLLLFFLRTELVSQWQQQLPSSAPNTFLVNINPADRTQLDAFFSQHQLVTGPFYPMVAGRVTAVNNEPLIEPDENSPSNRDGTNSRREGFGRELNLTWTSQLPTANEIVEGQWFTANSAAEVSIESKQAERLGLEIGDKLSLQIGGFTKVATVSSIRKVDWNSLQPNFFLILSPDLMTDIPATQMTALRVPPEQAALMNEFSRSWPTVTQISVQQIITQVQEVIAQVSLALTFILCLIVAAAVLVLVAQIQSTVDERQRELALLRTLGAKTKFLRLSVIYELAMLGAIAGLLASMLAEAVLALIQQQLSGTPFNLHPEFWLLGPLIGAFCVTLVGSLLLGKVMVPTPAQVIRQALAEQ